MLFIKRIQILLPLMKKNKIKKYLLIFLLIFLPWHGTISVFLPSPFTYWKEIILCLFFITSFDLKIKHQRFSKSIKETLKTPSFWAFLFLLWLFILVTLNKFDYYSIVSARYLGTGFFVFLLFSHYFSKSQNSKKEIEKSFVYFVYSCVLSVLFGIWAKFGNGFEILKNFYSQTISSWVPGQTIPIFHETNGFIRMQGASSGPIEFSHLLVMALFLLLFIKPFRLTFFEKILKKLLNVTSKKPIENGFLFSILIFGIFQSFSRAAILANVLLIGTYLWQTKKSVNALNIKTKMISGFIIFLLTLSFCLYKKDFLQKHIIQRIGTSEHFTRPIETIKIGLKKPFLGNLGMIGPAARMQNLKENNNDQAPIAENIFADYFAQMGFFGLIFAFGFFTSLFFKIPKKHWGLPLVILLLGNLATILDMMPISITFFIILAWLTNFRQKQTFTFLSAKSKNLNKARKITKKTVGHFIEKSFKNGWDDTIFQENFIPEKTKFIIINQKKIGLLQTEIRDKKELYVVNLLLLKPFQKQGIGSEILNLLFEDAKKQNLELTLSVHKINFNAQKFYSKIGFKKTQETKTHFFLKKI